MLSPRTSYYLIWFLYLITLIFGQVRRDFKKNYFDAKFDVVNQNKRLTKNIIMKVSEPSAFKCVQKCILHQRCKSINVNIETKECELLDSTTSENGIKSELIEALGWMHYDYHPEDPNAFCFRYDSDEVCCPNGRIGKYCNREMRILSIPAHTINVAHVTKHMREVHEFTICGWLNSTAQNGHVAVFSPPENYILINFIGGKLKFLHGGESFDTALTPVLNLNEWHHVCIAKYVQNNVAHLVTYHNGRVITHLTSPSNMHTSPFPENDYFIAIGNDIDNGIINNAGQSFLGQLMGWNFYTKKLSLDEIISDYHGEEINNDDLGFSWEEFQWN